MTFQKLLRKLPKKHFLYRFLATLLSQQFSE